VVDRHLRTVAAGDRSGQAGVEVRPLPHGVLHRDVLVLGVELVHQLLHHRAVTTGKAIPEGQLHSGAVVGLPTAAGGRGAATTAATGAGGQSSPSARGGECGQEASAAQSGVSAVGRRVHTYSFVMSVRSSVKGVTQRAAALLSLVWWRSDAALQRITRSMSTDFFLRCKEGADPAACSRLRESALVLVRENSGARGRERWVPRPKRPREPQRRAFAK